MITTRQYKRTHRVPGAGRGRSELVIVAILLVTAVFLTIGTATMDVQGEAAPGPRFFPVLVCIVLYATATALAVDIIRRSRSSESDTPPDAGHLSHEAFQDPSFSDEERTTTRQSGTASPTAKGRSDWTTVGQIVGGVVVFTLLLPVAGWILCAAFLFWVVARALGSRRPAFDLGVALLFSSSIQLAFNAGLGLNLPSGFLGGTL